MANASTDWYRDQVVLLTGGTGNLGACLLYKLALQLPTRKIFVLARGSVRRAVGKLEASIPDHVDDILDTSRVHFVVGETTQPGLGLKPTDLQRLQDEVTVAINAAADISLQQPLAGSVRVNCVAHLNFVTLLRSFTRLAAFLHVSSTSVNSFLPSGKVEERIYPLSENEPDPKEILSTIQTTGQSSWGDRFIAPYSLSKYLAERLILHQADDLPFSVLIVRPAVIAPAIRHPYPLYGSSEGLPLHSTLQVLVTSPDYGLARLAEEIDPETVVDEVPVDLVASTCLGHLSARTTGVVHASGLLYAPLTVGDLATALIQHTPPSVADKVLGGHLPAEDLAPHFFHLATQYAGKWENSCLRSEPLKSVCGPLGLSLHGHDSEAFMNLRWKTMTKVSDQIDKIPIPPGS
ncbi:hypothetical protein ASPWEDRAFT_40163 [Aspergillus wentii DTO 134E9]|uniref:Fatty acyl-CoA reductase n=1 Tax=Aspergillus wentii DTO 134E9 TaxID=1073089 RepID=A0A1L9RJB8_ASPWE|nr:uncharacterized protein ASPWEDRAFT_40163 [Aspergillus wentii DTO 134E9]KAI9932014.1 hypothetical protein MW887_009517 [Aspergillus wentii]OJJ35030.1 hypothetical protein ASPWEDRAFT_40163 [Aspergillus wentii DTO 134E9]